jgi:hypothetical protein
MHFGEDQQGRGYRQLLTLEKSHQATDANTGLAKSRKFPRAT